MLDAVRDAVRDAVLDDARRLTLCAGVASPQWKRTAVHAACALLSATLASAPYSGQTTHRHIVLGVLLGTLLEAQHADRPDSNFQVTSAALAAALTTTAARWREPTPNRPPRRSWRDGFLVMVAASLFWVAVAYSSLMRLPVAVTVDGMAAELSAARLLRCAACALRPDRLAGIFAHWQEPMCIKQALLEVLGRHFERFCVLPQSLNKCFDWDVAGTRWQRVGLTLSEAYRALGLSSWASAREVKEAHRHAVLENHPDKVQFEPGSQEAAAAALAFMKAQKAFETITEARKPRLPPPTASPPIRTTTRPRSKADRPPPSSRRRTKPTRPSPK